MKILQVIPYFTWPHGGPVRVVHDLSNKLSERGHEVTIYTTDVGLNHRSKENDRVKFGNNVEIHYFKCLNNWIAKRLALNISGQMRRAIKNQLKFFDVVHLHEFRGIPNVYVWYYSQKYNIPYVLQAHGAAPIVIGRQDRTRTFSKIIFDSVFSKKIAKGASKIIALTNTEVRQYRDAGIDDDKIVIVPNGINLPEYQNLPQKGEFRKKYAFRDDEKIILYLGRINRIKGIDLLVNAFSDLTKVFDDVTLVIAGPDDGFLSTLKKRIQDLKIGSRILLVGALYEREKLEAYVDADVYVLPSTYEIFSIATLEACACGTPVIITDRCGIAHFVDNKMGLVSGYDKDQLRDTIIKVLADEEIRRMLGEYGKRAVRELFNLEKITLMFEQIYESVL